MKTIIALSILAIATMTYGQKISCTRIIGHTCKYERIFMKPGGLMTKGIKTLDDIKGSPALSLDPAHMASFQVDANERTNDWSRTLLQSMDTHIRIQSPKQSILPDLEIQTLLRRCCVIPKDLWLGKDHSHTENTPRYVVACFVETMGNVVIDIHPSGFAVVFYENGTYSCLADPSHSCIKQPQPEHGPYRDNAR